MSFSIRENVVEVMHIEGCGRSRHCGPKCERITKGWLVDFTLRVPHRKKPWRRRENIPDEWAETKGKRSDWAAEREAYWLKSLLAREEEQSNITVAELVEQWKLQREGEGADVSQEMQRFRDHILPVLGAMMVVEVRPRHIRALVMALRRKASRRGGNLAPRTVRQIYFQTKAIFHYAALEEVITGNPVIVDRGVVPKKADKDPGWRKGAVFTKDEVETILFSDKIPPYRRVLYAISFLTGLRPGQVFELRWGDYEPEFEVMPRLSSSRAWESKKKKVKPTKTEVDHLVPVHPVLAAILAKWKLSGWKERHGRDPKGDDLIVPNQNGDHHDVRKVLETFLEDLERLGLRRRRQYDSRRTFMSLAMNAGASKDLVKYITHPRPADVFDMYVTPSWEALCGAVRVIKVAWKGGDNVVPLHEKVAVSGSILAVDAARGG